MNEQLEFVWYGKPSTELTREELLEVIRFLWTEKQEMQERARQTLTMLNLRRP